MSCRCTHTPTASRGSTSKRRWLTSLPALTTWVESMNRTSPAWSGGEHGGVDVLDRPPVDRHPPLVVGAEQPLDERRVRLDERDGGVGQVAVDGVEDERRRVARADLDDAAGSHVAQHGVQHGAVAVGVGGVVEPVPPRAAPVLVFVQIGAAVGAGGVEQVGERRQQGELLVLAQVDAREGPLRGHAGPRPAGRSRRGRGTASRSARSAPMPRRGRGGAGSRWRARGPAARRSACGPTDRRSSGPRPSGCEGHGRRGERWRPG